MVSVLDYHSNGRGSNPGRGRIEVNLPHATQPVDPVWAINRDQGLHHVQHTANRNENRNDIGIEYYNQLLYLNKVIGVQISGVA